MAPKAVLIGLPGAGKSTIGRRLAKALGVTMCDTDVQIETVTGRRIAEIFAAEGEAGFRRIEEDIVRRALVDQNGVVSLGGGAITTPGVRNALVGHPVVYLEISVDEGVRRTGGSTVRPLLAGPDRREKYRALVSERVPMYRRAATIQVNTDRRNPRTVVRYIVSQLESAAGHQKTASPAPPAVPASSAPTPATAAALAARRTRRTSMTENAAP